MTAQEKRNKLIDAALTRKQKNQYSQEASKRTRIESGYGDCSGTVWYWYHKLFGMDIGGNTEAQINSKLGKRVPMTIKNGIPDESKMQKGDLLFFSGINASSSSAKVSHVGIYIGNGEFLHAANSSRGVVIDDLDTDYYKKHYVTARRVIR